MRVVTDSFEARWGIAVLSIGAFAALLTVAGCSPEETKKEPLVTVRAVAAEKKPVSEFVSAEAVVFPLRQASVSPKITSTIAEFKVQRGSRVKKGQLLAILENKDLAAQAEASRGDFEQADANYAIAVNAGLPQQVQKAELDAVAAKSAFDAAQKVFDSRKELYDQGAIPRRDLDTAGVALAQARSQNEQAQKQLADLHKIGKEQLMKAAKGTKESAEGHYRAATAQLSYSEIRSPIDGVVTDRPLFVGDLATANQPILTVMDTSSLVAKAHIAYTDATQLRVGDTAQIKVPEAEESVLGRVSLISPALDPGSTTVEIWVETNKPTSVLKPGMTVDMEIRAKTTKDAIAVPTEAVFKNAEGAWCVLLAGQDKKAHQRVVQLGARNSELTQVTSGIGVGDAVVVTGAYAIPDGTSIELEKSSSNEKNGQAEHGSEPTKDKE